MFGRVRYAVGALALGTALVLTPVSAAQAQPNQGGLVNVAIGDITLRDINVGLAAQIVAAACDAVDVNAAVLAIQGVRSGGGPFECTAEGGNVRVFQE